MHSSITATTLEDVVFSVIPDLNQAETLVLNTLKNLAERASDPFEVLRRKEQKERFTLEVYRLRLSLEALLERHREDVDALLANENHRPAPLSLKDIEKVAIGEAIAIYQHVRAFQRGERVAPHPALTSF